MARKKTTEETSGGFRPIEVSVPVLTSPVATSEVNVVTTPTGDVAVEPTTQES